MPETAEDGPRARALRALIETFVEGLAKGSKTSTLYKEGHPTALLIAARTVELLRKAIGERTSLPLELKGKAFVFEEQELSATPESGALAASLHTLGVGQVLFTTRLEAEGMGQLFRLLQLKADAKTSLSDLQRQLQLTRIDGLQLTMVQNFVVTGEQEEEDQPPGRLTEEQVQAFCRAATLPDLLTLLLRQNESVHGKEADAVDSLLDGALGRSVTLEELTAGMPWSCYDPRIRSRFDALVAGCGPGAPRGAAWLAGWAARHEDSERARLDERAGHETTEASAWCLEATLGHLAKPVNEHVPRFAMGAYGRLLEDLGRGGRVDALLEEAPRWDAWASTPALAPHLPALRARVAERVAGRPVAFGVTERLASLSAQDPAFERLVALVVALGEGMMPLLIEALSQTQDKAHREKLCVFLGRAARALGPGALLAALDDPDYFTAVQAAGVLAELDVDGHAPAIAKLLKHKHPKAREASWRTLVKSKSPLALAALAAYVAAGEPEETGKAVIALSLTRHEGLPAALVAACRKTPHEATRVALLTALARHPSPATTALLKESVRRSWYEVLTRRRLELSEAAKRSLETLKKDGNL